MKNKISLVFLILTTAQAPAQENIEGNDTLPPPQIVSGESADLNEYLWKNRPLIVFSDTPEDPRYIQQMAYITDRFDALSERDVVVLTDTNPAAKSPLRTKLRPRGFMLILIGKDGIKYLRKPFPWNVREITRTIDKLPARQQEIRDGLNGG